MGQELICVDDWIQFQASSDIAATVMVCPTPPLHLKPVPPCELCACVLPRSCDVNLTDCCSRRLRILAWSSTVPTLPRPQPPPSWWRLSSNSSQWRMSRCRFDRRGRQCKPVKSQFTLLCLTSSAGKHLAATKILFRQVASMTLLI